VLSKQAVPILVSLVVSFVAVLLTTGLLGRWLLPARQTVVGGVASGPVLAAAKEDLR
jgi:putative effector of murein hydrolase LrgA (UPF0299 family)